MFDLPTSYEPLPLFPMFGETLVKFISYLHLKNILPVLHSFDINFRYV